MGLAGSELTAGTSLTSTVNAWLLLAGFGSAPPVETFAASAVEPGRSGTTTIFTLPASPLTTVPSEQSTRPDPRVWLHDFEDAALMKVTWWGSTSTIWTFWAVSAVGPVLRAVSVYVSRCPTLTGWLALPVRAMSTMPPDS